MNRGADRRTAPVSTAIEKSDRYIRTLSIYEHIGVS